MTVSIPRRKAFLVTGVAVLVAACGAERISDSGSIRDIPPVDGVGVARTERVSVCHTSDLVSTVKELPLAALKGHRDHGDYVTSLRVSPQATEGDGIHFRRITDALAAARDTRQERGETDQGSCRITIDVSADNYRGSIVQSADVTLEQFPLVIDMPDVTLRGALAMPLDASGKATGVGSGDVATTLTPTAALTGGGTSGNSQNILVVNGRVNGARGHRAIVEGFRLVSGRAPGDAVVGGIGILVLRAQGVSIAGNQFESGFASAVDLRASGGTVERVYTSGLGSSCDICVAGPGEYVVRDNRIIGGGTPGILILPAVLLSVPASLEQYTLPATATVTALVQNNEVRAHTRQPVGVGLRVGAVGVGAQTVAGTARVTAIDNDLIGNTFGIIVEAAFLSQTDPTRRRGDIHLTTSGNTITGSCQHDVLVAMSNSQTALGIQNGAYLINSSYTLTLGSDIDWNNAWYAHAAGTGNSLIVNGQAIANGIVQAYDPTRSCP